jgi:phage FluMu protein Com
MLNEDKIILPCSSCQAKYNVTNLQGGTRFKCNKCGTINTVPIQEDAPTEFIPRQEVPQAIRKQGLPHPATSVKKSTVKMPQPQTRPSALSRQPMTAKGMSIKPSAFKRGLPAGRVVRGQATESSEDIEVKKNKKTWMIIGIAGGVVLLIIIIWAFSGGNKSKEEEQKAIKQAEEAAAAKEHEKSSQTTKEPEKTPEPEPKKVEQPKETRKPPKPKLEIDETLKAEISPLLKEMRKQNDEEQKSSREKIIGKGKKAIPILIETIGGEDEWAAMYAYEILIKMTKRNRDDTQKVNQMLSRDMRKDCQKEWEEWWFKNKDSIPE